MHKMIMVQPAYYRSIILLLLILHAKKAVTQQAAELDEDWSIHRYGDVTVNFNEENKDGEIKCALNVTTNRVDTIRPLKIHDYQTCRNQSYSSL